MHMSASENKAACPPQGGQVYKKAYYAGLNSNYIFWYGNMRHKIFWRRRIATLKKFIHKGRVLDVGCAFGFFIKFLDKEFDVYGVDVSEYAAKRAEALLGEKDRIKCCDVQNGITFGGKFDAVTAFDIMEHTHNPQAVLSVIHSALNDKGILYLEFPFAETLIGFDKGHYYRPLNEWLGYLEQAGFKLRQVRNYYTIGFRAFMFPAKRMANYSSIVAERI